MKEVVRKILRQEEEARLGIESARAEAESIIAKAKKDSEALIEETITQVKDLIQKKTKESTQEFLAEKENVLAASRDEAVTLRKAREKDTPDISRTVFLEIINIED
jgi:vacuolar-type H+-ATPase subunit H